MNLFGGCTTARDSYSYAAAEVIMPHIVGPMARLLIEHTSWKAVAEGARLVVAFGGMAPRNGQINSGGTGKPHAAPGHARGPAGRCRIRQCQPVRNRHDAGDAGAMAADPTPTPIWR